MSAPAVTPVVRSEHEDDTHIDRALLMVALVVVLASTMPMIDGTAVNIALDAMADTLRAPLTTIQWVATGYTLALALVVPITGWAVDRFGTRRVYIASTATFVLGSALSGIAWSSTALIAARVLQGFGGGMIGPAGMIVLTYAAGPKRLGRLMSVAAIPVVLGPIAGPVLAGWLVTNLSWRWIFYINLPVGAITIVLCRRVLNDPPERAGQPFDWTGLFLLVPGLSLVVIALADIGSTGRILSAAVIGPALGGGCALALFVRHSLGDPDALIDMRLFSNRTFAAASGVLFLLFVAVFGAILLIPLYLQAVRGQSAVQTGLLVLPVGVGAALSVAASGLLSDRVAMGRIVPAGIALLAAAFLGLTRLELSTSFVSIGATFFVFGMGIGAVMVPMFAGTMRVLRRDQVARASAAVNIIQQLGAAVGTVLLSVVLAHNLDLRALHHVGIGTAHRRYDGAFAAIADHAFARTFWVSLVLLGVAFVCASLFLPKARPTDVAAADDDEIGLGAGEHA